MVQIGTIEYEARVSNVDEAQSNAQDFADTHRDVGEAAEGTAGSVGLLAGTFGSAAFGANQAGDEADEADTEFTLLRGTIGGVTRAFGRLFRMLAGGTVLSTIAGAAGKLTGILGGLTLSGVVGTVTGAISSFVGWVAAGSAGALAFAGAIGAAIGLFAVWILKITGVIDMIGNLGNALANDLPGWARDGVLAVIGLFAGPLAAIGGFIIGFIEGGFSEGFARASQVTNIFFGAFRRTFGRIGQVVSQTVRGIVSFFRRGFGRVRAFVMGILNGIRGRIGRLLGRVRDLQNAARNAADLVPGSGSDSGGILSGVVEFGRSNLPSLQTGGTVSGSGIARVHEGEVVGEPGALIEAAGMSSAAGGGGDTTIDVSTINIEMSGEFDPSNVSRRELDSLADRLVDLIGDKTNRRAGVR